VVQLSIDETQPHSFHHEICKRLALLREEGDSHLGKRRPRAQFARLCLEKACTENLRTRDPKWLLVDEGFTLAREHETESLFAIGNGYVGNRGSLAEGSPLSSPATSWPGYSSSLMLPDRFQS
jgi:hypothetical protein